jgi:hypothetical protein
METLTNAIVNERFMNKVPEGNHSQLHSYIQRVAA